VHIEPVTAIADIKSAEWNSLAGTEFPFLRHEFLDALEKSGCVGDGTGWEPCHLALRDAQDTLHGAIPLYRKTDSWGEFVFDFAWADAYHRAGLAYYPKIVSAVPFTPATSPRCLIKSGESPAKLAPLLLGHARKFTEQSGASSLHFLFPANQEKEALSAAGFMLRKDCQFHWHNRGYQSFDDFLNEFTSAKRKKVRRERRRIREAGIRFRFLTGQDLDETTWNAIMPLYASSFWRRGRHPYLNQKFFLNLTATIPDQIVVILAETDNSPIAVAICFRSKDTLYGRYWGSVDRFHSLHFETCYYQGIEFCIANKLMRFEPGTQGEHKLSRGFEPTATWSAHWLSHPQFFAAVDTYLQREKEYINEYIEAATEHTPYRRSKNRTS